MTCIWMKPRIAKAFEDLKFGVVENFMKEILIWRLQVENKTTYVIYKISSCKESMTPKKLKF